MQSSPFKQVYQFKVTLKGVRPPIWRRIRVPETYTFWELHVAIQDAMGWLDYHLHAFHGQDPTTGREEEIGIPDDDGEAWDPQVIPGWERRIAPFFTPGNPRMEYVYDFGDDWQHEIKLEKILPSQEDVTYPRCVAGKRACPPEDCGGVWGYGELLEIISDPSICDPNIRTIPTAKPTEGVGVVEAPRGTLYHHYITDDRGIVQQANLIVGTTNNHAAISMSIKKAAQGVIQPGKEVSEGILNMVEMAFRAYDPCFGCATHTLPGQMPLEICLRNLRGEILQTLRRK